MVSYGQILGMNVWKDDNAIFFKFDHINEDTGFFGKGIFGVGPYKFSIAPYYPIYKVFGNENIVPYYSLILLFYFISTLCVYYLFGKMISPTAGKVASFLFASGFIASGGFYWLANAMLANLAILSLSLILFFYYRYCRVRKLYNYLLAVAFYFICSALFPLRTMYFIQIIIAFELIYLGFWKFPKSLIGSLIRILPFVAIFNYYFISQLDKRASTVNDYIIAVFFKGEIYQLFSFFTSLSNLLIYDYLMSAITNIRFVTIISFFLLSVLYFLVFKKTKKGIFFTIGSITLTIIWYFAVKILFHNQHLSLININFLEVFFGGVICYLLLLLFLFVDGKTKKHVLFLTIFLFTSIATYSAYAPTAFFGTIHHYFTNSFVAEVGLLAILYIYLRSRKNFWGNIGATLIIFWGIANIGSSVYFENKILNNRSIPTFNFYNSLKDSIPKIEKGDLLYFDVNQNANNYFASAFSVSSMPETTAIAWRYGIDRYDFTMVSDFEELLYKLSKKESTIDDIHSFYYEKNGLINTTTSLREALKNGSIISPLQISQEASSLIRLTGTINKPISPLLLTVKAKVSPAENINFPYSNKAQKIEKMITYLLARQDYYKSVSATSLSQWKFQEIPNVVDNNLDTSWRGHRIYWHEHKHEQLILNLGSERKISKVVWTNWNHTLTPISYSIDTSIDGNVWQSVKTISNGPERKDGEMVEENFKEIQAQFVRMDITGTFSNDAPALSEFEVIDSVFNSVNIAASFQFAKSPFNYVNNQKEIDLIFSNLAQLLNIQVKIETDKGVLIQEASIDSFNQINTYEFVLPASGTIIKKLEISVADAPVKIDIQSALLQNLSFKQIQERGLIKKFVEN